MKAKQNIVGDRVRQLRCAQKMTQNDLVARCQCIGWHVIRETIIKIEHGTRRVIDAEVVLLAQALHCSCSDLLDSDENHALDSLSSSRESKMHD